MTNISCWICGAPATTREHKTKRTDLLAVIGRPTQQRPMFVTDRHKLNRRVASLKSDVLKFPSHLCEACNSARTQPHDRAWEQASESLRTRRPPAAPGIVVQINRIFPYGTAVRMRDVHLYFVKLFGCHLVQENIQVDVSTFGQAILRNRPHPRVWLKFGIGAPLGGEPRTGMTNMHVWSDGTSGVCMFPYWDYYVAGIGVRVIYAVEGMPWDDVGAWHPRLGAGKLVFADLAPNAPGAW